MALKQPGKASNSGRKPTARPAAARSGTRSAGAAVTGGDSKRLMREAAWSRMFGRTDAKNPFTR